MPRYLPNTRFSDCWSSVGEVTFFHKDGVCFWKNRAHPVFPGTAAQLEQQEIHLRALAAWRELSPIVQEQWNMLALTVPSHRPPFDKKHHISGHNLFVSAYHGFAQLGNEHVPVPRSYEDLPIFTCDYACAVVVNGSDLSLRLRVRLEPGIDPARYRLSTRLQLTRPGCGRNSGFLRSFIASTNCSATDCIVEIYVPGFRSVWNLDTDLSSYQVHMRYLLIDSETGYRNIFRRKSFLMEL